MENKRSNYKAEYTGLSPIERNAKLIQFLEMFPKTDLNNEWIEALREETRSLNMHNEFRKSGV